MVRTTRLKIALAMVGAGLLSACSQEAPYAYTDYRNHQRGQVIICYDGSAADKAKAQALAEEICKQYDRTAKFNFEQPYQCSWTSPTQAIYSCVARPGETPPPVVPANPPMRHDPQLGPE